MFLEQLISGLTLGCIYALIALGYTMVYGILKFINFAHGEIYMVGAYLGYYALVYLSGIPWLAAHPLILLLSMFLCSMAGCGLLGITIDAIAYRPLRQAPRLAPLISAVGVSLILQNVVMLVCGSENKSVPSLIPTMSFYIGDSSISLIQIFIMGSSVILMLLLHGFIKKTLIGKAMRAIAQNKKAASLMGIPVNSVIALTFLVGSALGAAAGVMVGMYYGVINFFIGYMAGLKAFTAAVLGGIGSIPGAMLGGLLLGVVESLGAGSCPRNTRMFLLLSF